MTPAPPRADPDPILCGVCRRRATGLGYMPRNRDPVVWLCDDPVCLSLGRSVYHMSQPMLDAIEARARNDALSALGAYLDSIGTTDLAALTPDQFFEVGSIFVREFADAMRRHIGEQAAPF